MEDINGMSATDTVKLLDTGETVKFPVQYSTTIFLQLAKLRPKQQFVGMMIGQQMALSFVEDKISQN